ncbi:MAG: O-antigen ligase family protein, partial [Rhizobiales bacterium]|nr:O-antigen ligase family protein [Hyphomicrobiales bacterium]
TLVAGPLLLAIVGFTHLRLKGSLVIVAVCAGLGATVWLASPDVRERTSLFAEFATGAAVTDASGSLRLQFWRIAVDKVKEAPVFGSGTGSLRGLFSTAKTDGVVDLSAGTENPHNQTFAIAIQVGVIGLLVLYGLWLAHALLFIRSGAAEASRIVWASRFGLLIVVQNFLGSLFNTHLSDFTSGWLYALGVGILGGTVLRPHLTYRRGPAA